MTQESISIVGCHAGGEVGDVIVSGVPLPPGDTIWEQSRWIASDGGLRDFVLNEPRGGVYRHANLVVPPVHPDADLGFIIMEPVHTPPMSGSNAMCVATVALETGLLAMDEPVTEVTLEAPGGLVKVRARCENGKVLDVTIRNVPSFVGQRDATLEVEGLGTIRVDTAYGGDTFVMVDAGAIGATIEPTEAHELAGVGARIAAAATDQLGFVHPDLPDWRHVSFCQIAGPVGREGAHLTMRNAVAIAPGKIDRSPTGTGTSARMALLVDQGAMSVGEGLVMRSIIGSEFLGTVAAQTTVGTKTAIIPTISGRAWITGRTELTLDPTDPWPGGYRLSDTWPGG